MKIQITDSIFIDGSCIAYNFVRSSGPGGQNVNKVSTACELRYNIKDDLIIPFHIKVRLLQLAANRISKEGILIIDGNEHRTQEMNREAVFKRLTSIVIQSSIIPKKRTKTKPSFGAIQKRLSDKKHNSLNKNQRRNSID